MLAAPGLTPLFVNFESMTAKPKAKLAHLERAAQQRPRDLQEATAPRSEAQARIRALEDKVRLTTSSSEHIDSAKLEALRQVSECHLSTRTM